MSLAVLKWLRFATSGIVIIVSAFLFGKMTRAWDFDLPRDVNEYFKMIWVLILAGAYYITPLRDWANRRFFDRVSENIRSQLVIISGLEDRDRFLSWKSVRPVFFYIIDNDKSLKEKASLAYFNGYIWTTLADIRAVSVIFALTSVVFWFFGRDYVLGSVLFFSVTALLSYVASDFVTRRHQEIGNQQIEIIKTYYKDDLYKKLRGIRD